MSYEQAFTGVSSRIEGEGKDRKVSAIYSLVDRSRGVREVFGVVLTKIGEQSLTGEEYRPDREFTPVPKSGPGSPGYVPTEEELAKPTKPASAEPDKAKK